VPFLGVPDRAVKQLSPESKVRLDIATQATVNERSLSFSYLLWKISDMQGSWIEMTSCPRRGKILAYSRDMRRDGFP